jgi:hypothetical protein
MLEAWATIDRVTELGEHSVRLSVSAPELVAVIVSLGGEATVNPSEWRIEWFRKAELLDVVQRLLDVGMVFEGGVSGWPSAAIAAEWRDRGLVSGTVRMLVNRSGPEIQEV